MKTELPQIPGIGDEREASVATPLNLDPQSTLATSGKTGNQGENFLLDSNVNESSWAMYSYQAGENDLISLRLTFSYPNGPGAWVALANYQTGRWEWKSKAILTQQTYQLNTTAVRNYVSPQGNLYFVVLSAADEDVLITDLLAVVDLPPPPTFTVSGRVTNANLAGIPGIQLSLTPGGDQTNTDVNGNYVFSGYVAGSYTITPTSVDFSFDPISLVADVVSKDITDLNFIGESTAQPVTYVDDIESLIDGDNGNERSCLDCHEGQFPEADLDLTTYASVRDNASEISFRVNLPDDDEDRMPRFADKWSQANLDLFQAWIDGGLLEN